jgi:phage N-6-adenine-methyltransferase
VSGYEQLDMFELTAKVCDTAKRIAEGEIVNAEDKLDLAEMIYEARRRMPANREFGAWWRTTGISYSRPWRAVLLRAGQRIATEGRPVVNRVNNGGEFSVKRYAETGDGLIVGDDEPTAHVSQNTGMPEWYTPAELIGAARLVLGGIDLDPASSDIANATVGADRYYTADDDGLAQTWEGRVWMNPPYNAGLVDRFVAKLLDERAAGNVTAALVLTNNSTDTRWWQSMAERATAVCHLAGRVKFIAPDGEHGAPLQGQTICYLGDDADGFAKRFDGFGVVL